MSSINALTRCLALAALIVTGCGREPAGSRPPIPEDRLLTHEAIFQDKAYDAESPKSVHWLEDGSGYTVLEDVEDADAEQNNEAPVDDEEAEGPKDIVFYDPETLESKTLVTAAQLTPAGAEQALSVDDYAWSDDGSKLLVYANAERVWREKDRGDYWLLDLDSGELWRLGGEGMEASSMSFAKLSPDSGHVAYVRDNDIYVQDLVSRDIVRLTSRESESIINGRFSWAYEEEFSIRDGFRWSPDSRRIAYWQFDTSGVKDFMLINNTDELYPTITHIPYPKVGETISAARIGVVDIDTGSTVWARLPGDPRDSYIPRMGWADNSEQLIVQHVNRKQDTNDVYFADATSGAATLLFTEKEIHFLDDFLDVEWLDGGKAFTWISERSGWRHVHRVSRDGGAVVDLTPGDFDIVEVTSLDEDGGWLYFVASPENPTQRYLYRTRLDGSGGMERITPAEYGGTNSYQVAPGARWAIHTHSSFMQPPQYRLVALPEHRVTHVLEDNQSLLGKLAGLELGEHEFFRVEVRDGLELDGYLIRPPGFDPARRYPLVNYVYGEVAGQTVRDMWGGSRHLWHLLLSQRGFLVASVDNRGTRSPRGRDWRKSVYGAIGVLASRDQSDALNAMQERWSWIDPARTGIWGHSGGGSMTLNMLFRYPEQYEVGISRAPVTDQRLYDAIYQERYSGLLDEYADGYREASPITHASKLEGRLLLIHGTGDDNVHYQGSERLIDELVKHNKPFDFMSYPNRTHAIREGEGTELHMYSKMTGYFTEHLRP